MGDQFKQWVSTDTQEIENMFERESKLLFTEEKIIA